MIRIILCGIGGFMGKTLMDVIAQKPNEQMTVVAGVDARTCEHVDIPTYTDFHDVREEADVVIDFSRPDAVYEILPFCREHGLGAVIGTTGLSDKEREFMDTYAPYVAIFESGNLSLGVNLQLNLVKKAASTLGSDFETEIIEKHHHFKVDSPSGTALMLGNAVASQFPEGRSFTFGRYTKTERRKPSEIGFHSVRGGTIVGEHEVMFIGRDEIVEVNHRAFSKQVFAEGAIRAAKFIVGKQPGLYNMQDIVVDRDIASNIYVSDEQSLISLYDLRGMDEITDVFDALAKQCVFVDMISLNMPRAMSFSVRRKQLFSAVGTIQALKGRLNINMTYIENLSKLTVKGVGMEQRHGVAASLFGVLKKADVTPLIVTTSETKIEYGIESEAVAKALGALSDYLDL